MGKKDQNVDTFIIGKFLIIVNHLHWRWLVKSEKLWKKLWESIFTIMDTLELTELLNDRFKIFSSPWNKVKTIIAKNYSSHFLKHTMMMMVMMVKLNCFCGIIDRRKAFSVGTSEILIIANLWHADSRIRACVELELRHFWMKLGGSDKHYTMKPQINHHMKIY